MIRVGQVSGVFGVRGAVKVHSLTEFDDRFDAGSELHLRGVAHTVEWRQEAGGSLVLKLSGLDAQGVSRRAGHQPRLVAVDRAERLYNLASSQPANQT